MSRVVESSFFYATERDQAHGTLDEVEVWEAYSRSDAIVLRAASGEKDARVFVNPRALRDALSAHLGDDAESLIEAARDEGFEAGKRFSLSTDPGVEPDRLIPWVRERICSDRTENATVVWRRLLRELELGRFGPVTPAPVTSGGYVGTFRHTDSDGDELTIHEHPGRPGSVIVDAQPGTRDDADDFYGVEVPIRALLSDLGRRLDVDPLADWERALLTKPERDAEYQRGVEAGRAEATAAAATDIVDRKSVGTLSVQIVPEIDTKALEYGARIAIAGVLASISSDLLPEEEEA